MFDIAGQIRQVIACYGAAIAITLEQLVSVPISSMAQTPTPLVRIREQNLDVSDWHPAELFTSRSGERTVLVLGYQECESQATSSTLNLN